MYIEVPASEHREWNSKNTVYQRKRKIEALHTRLSLDASVSNADYESLHEFVPSDFNLERLAADRVLIEELRRALQKWKP